MSFWQKIVRFFKGAGAAVSKFFVTVLGEKAAKTLGDAAVYALQSALGEIAEQVVVAVATLQVTGEEKRKEAFGRIVEIAKTRGLQYSTSLINLLIELAVQRVKDNIVPIGE